MPDLTPVYDRLEALLGKHTAGLEVSHDFADAKPSCQNVTTCFGRAGF